jgi:hypothetical protein
MGRFKQSLVALQLIAVSEANDVRKIKEHMFISTLSSATINSNINRIYTSSLTMYIPLTLEAVGCGMHNSLVINHTLYTIAGKRGSLIYLLCISLRTRLFLSRETNASLIIEIRPILRDRLGFFLAFIFYFVVTTLPQSDLISHFTFIFNLGQKSGTALPCVATFASIKLFIVMGVDFNMLTAEIPHFICAFTLTISELLRENYNSGVTFKILSLTDAVNNCETLLTEMTARYNRLRQEAITNALLELSSFLI